MAGSGLLAAKLRRLVYHLDLSQALAAFESMAELRAGHARAIASGLGEDPCAVSRLLAFCAISIPGDLSYAKSLFAMADSPTRSMYNSMIRGFSKSSEPSEAVKLYRHLLRHGLSPDNITHAFLIRCCAKLGFASLGKTAHTHVLKLGSQTDLFVKNNAIAMYASFQDMESARLIFYENRRLGDVVSWTSMVSGYANSGCLTMARWFFDRMPSKNIISWNAIIAGYAKQGRKEEARELFDAMPHRNSASWAGLLSGFAQAGLWREAMAVFEEMVERGAQPGEAAFVSAVSACAQLRDLNHGERMHAKIEERSGEKSVVLSTALVEMYGKCGDAAKAMAIFNEMPRRNVYAWNSAMAGLAMNGRGEEALALFWKMVVAGEKPNETSFLSVLGACSHGGMVEEGQRLFAMMVGECGMRPWPEHYGCLVDLLGRAGLVEEARAMLESMPFEAEAGQIGALAGACGIHGRVEMGEMMAKKAIEMEPRHCGRYALLSNMFAAAMRWDDVVAVRTLLKERRGGKMAGSSLVAEKDLL